MSAGKNFLRSVIDQDTPKLVRRVREDYFTEDELPAFHLLRDHLDTYGVLPTLEVMRTNGNPLPNIRGTAATSDYYLDRVRKRFAYTQVNERYPQLTECMKNRDIDGMVGVLRDMISNAASAVEAENYVTMAEELSGVRDAYLTAKNNPGLQGIPFGWPTLDAITGGAQGGDLVVVAGRPSMGKSWLLLFMAWLARQSGQSVALTSMEMSLRQIARRLLGMHLRINPNYIRDGELSTTAESRMLNAVEQLQEDGGPPLHLLAGDMSKQVGGIENMIVEFNPDIVFVDSAYLLTPSGQKRGYISRWESISEVVGQLKALALKYDKPMVISVQFNRNQKSSSRKELDLGDIAGSDSIPQDASIVLGIRKGPSPFQDSQRIIECMKNREGETGKFATAFSFSPVDFNEVPLVEVDGEEDNDGTEYDGGWME